MSRRVLAASAAVLLLPLAWGCGGDDEEAAADTAARTEPAPALGADLRAAVRANDVPAAKRLLEGGADPNELDPTGESAFLVAAAADERELVELLLEHGGDVRAVDENGDTALIHAARNGSPELVEALIEAKSPLDHVNELGWTALLTAVVLGDGSEPFARTVEQLVAAGADPARADAHGISPLVHAQASGQSEIARILSDASG
jgi:uncharacterized protein